ATNPITGEQELMLVSESQDVQLGKKYAPELEKEMGGKIPDPALQEYINRIGQKIVRVSHRRNFEYHFVALNDKSVNALALPGGYVYITKGLLKQLTSEAQLAAILGHEVTHIVARDVAALMSREIGIDILLAAATPKKTPRAALIARDLTRQILGLRFSRQDERDADIGGLDYMVRAGYNPYGMVETMQMLQKLQKSRPVEFFSTHPNPENRIEYITEEIEVVYPNLQDRKTGADDYRTKVLTRLR
ncbi:MAG: M48 family metallopeptidase, partial [Planctomycetota bacterium]